MTWRVPVGAVLPLSMAPPATASTSLQLDLQEVTIFTTFAFPGWGDGLPGNVGTTVSCPATADATSADSFRLSVDPECLDGMVVASGTGYGYFDPELDALTGPLVVEVAGEQRVATWPQGLARTATLDLGEPEDRSLPVPDSDIVRFDSEQYPCDEVYLGVLPADGGAYGGEPLDCLLSAPDVGVSARSTDERVLGSDATSTVRAWVSEQPGRQAAGGSGLQSRLSWERPDGSGGSMEFTDDGFAPSLTSVVVTPSGDLVVGGGFGRNTVTDLYRLQFDGDEPGELERIDLPEWLGILGTQANQGARFDATDDGVVFAARLFPTTMTLAERAPFAEDIQTCSFGPDCVFDGTTDIYYWDFDTEEAVWLSDHRTSDTSGRDLVRSNEDPVISDNGEWVAFVSDADLDGLEQDKFTADDPDIFVVSTSDEELAARRVSRTPDGTAASNGAAPLQQHSPTISATGQFVVFVSNANDLDDATLESDFGNHVFVHDRDSDGVDGFDEPLGTTMTRAAYTSGRYAFGPAISDDGLVVSFMDRAFPGDPPTDSWVVMQRGSATESFTTEPPLLTSTPNAAQETTIHLFEDGRFALRTLNQWFVTSPSGLGDRFPAVTDQSVFTDLVRYRPVVSDPVDTGTGALVASSVDLSAPAGAALLEWSRSYNSLRPATSGFGPGWSHNWTDHIDTTGSVPVFVDRDGRRFGFTDDGTGRYIRPDELLADLTVTVDGFELAWFTGEVWSFDADGQLTARADWAGQSVDVTRNSDGTIAQLTASTGSTVTFVYTVESLLETAAMSDGRSVTYTYTGGVLTEVVNPDGTTTFTHDGADRIVTETDTTGVVVHTTEYNDDGRVIRQVLAHGEETLFSYDDSVPSTKITDVTSGDAVTYTFDDNARLVSITDPAGNQTFTNWNTDGQPTGSIDRLGHNPTAIYDANGNVTSITDPVRGATSYTYDTDNRVVSVTEPTGAITTMVYDGNERLPSTVTDALGAVTTFDTIDGLVVSVIDADGVTTAYGYDAQRRMDAMTNGLDNTWIYAFDAVGRQIGSTTPLGFTTSRSFDNAGRILTSTAADGGVTTYTYDADGRVLDVTDPIGAVTANTYDATSGLLESTTDPAGRVTTYVYNATAELVAVEANDGAVSETDYGTLGRVTATRDPLGRESTYAYDANGNRTEVVAPDGGVTRTEYDTAGRIAAMEDPIGRRTTNTYDDFGRLVSVTQPDGTVMSYTYDLLGRQIATVAPDGGTTTTTFTAAGRTATVTDAEGGVTTYGYDDAGRTVTVTDPNANTTTFDYDADGRRTGVITPEGLVTTTEYDPMGRVTKLIDPAGVEHTRTYTLRGELASEQREGDGLISYAYNPDGTMASVTDAVGNTTSFTYDAAGRQATRVDATEAVEVLEYNPAGELVAQIDRLGQRTQVGYDTNGRIASIADPSGRTISHTYNFAGELQTRSFGDGTSIAYSYDTMGRRTSMMDPTGVTTYDYDPNGRPIEVAAPNGTLDYSYDQAGRRTALTYPDGTVVSYDYDPAGRLVGLTDPNTGDIDYTLDDDGRLTLTELPDGQTREFTYVDGQMVRHQDHGRVTDLTYDNSGRIATLNGAQNHTYTYDPAGQLTQADQDEGIYAYTYGPRGEITSIADPDRSRIFTHNANVEIDSIVDDQGRPGDVTYDQAGRMIEHVDPDGTVTAYTYDARGLLIETVITTLGNNGGGGEPADPCAGLTPTITGTDGDDVIQGTWQDDIIFGLGGNDTIIGASGADIICGGDGNDTISGGSQDDIIYAGAGDDTVRGDSGADVIDGGSGNDILSGDSQDDTIQGGPGDDQISGNSGADTLDGGNGNDIVDGSWQTDTCDDAEQAISCETITTNGEPANTNTGAPGSPFTCNGLIASIVGTDGDDLLQGTWQDDVIVALGGNDTINGASGADTICGGDGNDTINGGSQDDTIVGETGNDTINGGPGADLIDGGAGDDIINGDSQNDTIQGGDGNDTINGGPDHDTLDGGNDTDTIDGSWQTDTCETEPTRISCETNLSGPVPAVTGTIIPEIQGESVTVESRSYDGEGYLTTSAIAAPNTAAAMHSFLWDGLRPVPQIVMLEDGTTSSEIVYGTTRELLGGTPTVSSALSDQIDPSQPPAQLAPFGPASTSTGGVSFGYRGELQTPAGVHLRARILTPSIGTMASVDPLDGVLGTPTVTNPYHYANNDPIGQIDPLGTRSTDTTLTVQVPSVVTDPWMVYYEDEIRRSNSPLRLSDLSFSPKEYLDQVLANASGWLRPGAGTCVGAQSGAGFSVTGDICLVALTNEFALVGSAAVGLIAGGGVSIGGGVLVTNAQRARQLEGDAVCLAASVGIGGVASVVTCAGVEKTGRPNGIFTITTSAEVGGSASGGVYMSTTTVRWSDNGYLYRLIESTIGRFSFGAAEASYCKGGVFNEEEARKQGVWAQSVC